MEEDLPYKVEYAKSGRASCKGCKTSIDKLELRIACMVQSAFHDGKQPNWYHEKCFFQKQRPQSEGDIANFQNLRYEDQQKIRKIISELGAGVVPPTGNAKGKGKKRSKEESVALKDFGIEYSKSGRASCRGCELKIAKDEIRVKKVAYDTEVGMKYGGQPLWHHVECFAQVRGELGWFETGEKLPGFNTLSKDDQNRVKNQIPAVKVEDIPDYKKMKTEPIDEKEAEENKKLEKLIAKQSKKFFKYRDYLQEEVKKEHILEILTENEQTTLEGDSGKFLDLAADILTFGALNRCPKCKGQFIFNTTGYLCTGNLTEWTKCADLVKEPSRRPCVIPGHLKGVYSLLDKYKCEVQNRAIRFVPPSAKALEIVGKIKKEDELDGPKVKREKPPLYNFQFVIVGLKEHEEILKSKIQKLGGRLVTRLSEQIMAIISTPKEVEKMSNRMKKAKELGIHVVPEDYLDSVESDPAGAVTYITSKTLCDWGTDPHARIPQEEAKSAKSKSIYTKSVPTKMKVTLKGGLAVDPSSGLENVAHVYVRGKQKFSVVLGLTDVQSNKNKYYKLQILRSDNQNRFWLFRSWGRIGTTIGGDKVEPCDTAEDAINKFEGLYTEKTGNDFINHNTDTFVKRPGLMYPIDIDYGEEKQSNLMAESKVPSKLPVEVQDLIKLIFDINAMKKAMSEFDLDMEKMPLGKLSKKQIESAYKVLTELSGLIENGGSNSSFIDCTNRFYTLIPHNFGVDSPPLLDTMEQIKNLSEMLDSLMEIELAYSMLSVEDDTGEVNPIDQHYEQLKTELIPLDKSTNEYKILEKYVENTHAETHRMYGLEIEQIYKVNRKGEAKRFKPFKKLHNRKLLWHGSRLTNFVGILSHGLKIAPPEAPATGYMFGKGIYFADMVSKSANYCFTSIQNSTGLLLLSEVALGNMFECTEANYLIKLPKDKHSTKGVGKTQPNPAESFKRDDGVEIPFGKAITNHKLKTNLLYNEYIVYDASQVNIQYLFKMNFKYKY